MKRKHALATLVAAAIVAAVAPSLPEALAAGGPNLSIGKTASASSSNSPYTAEQSERRQPGLLLGERRRLPAVGADRPRQHATSIDQVVLKLPDRLGGPHRDAVGAGQRRRRPASPRSSRSAGYAFDPASGNTVTINFTATTTRYVRAEHHRQHRLGGRAALRARGLRHRPRRPATWPPGKTMTESSHRRRLRAPATPTTATRPPTGRARTTRSRSGSRSTWAPSCQRQQGGAQAAAVDRLGHPHPDPRRAGQHAPAPASPTSWPRPGTRSTRPAATP